MVRLSCRSKANHRRLLRKVHLGGNERLHIVPEEITTAPLPFRWRECGKVFGGGEEEGLNTQYRVRSTKEPALTKGTRTILSPFRMPIKSRCLLSPGRRPGRRPTLRHQPPPERIGPGIESLGESPVLQFFKPGTIRAESGTTPFAAQPLHAGHQSPPGKE